MKLAEVDNWCPFTGEKNVNIKVTCRTVEQASLWFSPTSIFAPDGETYQAILKQIGLVEGKEYTITKLEGRGDVFDICVDIDGREVWLMESFFIDTNCEALRIEYTQPVDNYYKEEKHVVSYIVNQDYYKGYIDRVKNFPNYKSEIVHLKPTA